MKNELTLNLKASEFEDFCEQICSQPEAYLQSYLYLNAIKELLLIAGSDTDSNQYIDRLMAEKRAQLIDSNVSYLVTALKQCNSAFIAVIHNLLERNDFYQVLQAALPELSDDDIRLLMVWSANWIKEAAQLQKENQQLDPQEYRAMLDIDKVLNPQ